jgi:hypothetical protein
MTNQYLIHVQIMVVMYDMRITVIEHVTTNLVIGSVRFIDINL